MRYNIMLKCLCDSENDLGKDSTESGFDRVKRMYSEDIYGLPSSEMYYLIKSISATVFISGTVGAIVHMAGVKDNYFRQNTASVFESQHLARRKLTDTMTLSGLRGFYKYALKYGTFSSAYLLSTMTLANYYNKVTVWQHIGTGAMLGSILRLNFGLKGMAAAGSLGGVLGLLAGGVLVSYMRLTDTTLDDLRRLQQDSYYQMKRSRNASS